MNDAGPAFPHGSIGEVAQQGMSLRDYFAAKAMQGMTSNLDTEHIDYMATGTLDGDRISRAAYVVADAMLAERSK